MNRTFGYYDLHRNGGYIHSPGYPSSNYANKLYCKWSIRVAAPYRVRVTVEKADISHAAQAEGLGDSLRIDDGLNAMSSQENSAPWSFLSSAHLVRVVFLTDDRLTGMGFFLSFSRGILGYCCYYLFFFVVFALLLFKLLSEALLLLAFFWLATTVIDCYGVYNLS